MPLPISCTKYVPSLLSAFSVPKLPLQPGPVNTVNWRVFFAYSTDSGPVSILNVLQPTSSFTGPRPPDADVFIPAAHASLIVIFHHTGGVPGFAGVGLQSCSAASTWCTHCIAVL